MQYALSGDGYEGGGGDVDGRVKERGRKYGSKVWEGNNGNGDTGVEVWE